MNTELHVLNPCVEISQLPHSINWIGIVNGKLLIKVPAFSMKTGIMPPKEFTDYWLPPEMTMKKKQPFQALVTFDDTGEIVALGYPIGELTWGEAIDVVPMAGVADTEPRLRKVVSVAVSITDVAPTGKCVLTFRVVDHGGEKLFALPDGWFVDAIPALCDFENTRRLVRPQGAERRWRSSLYNLTIIRGGKIIAYGAFESTGGMGAYTRVYLPKFIEGNHAKQVGAERFEVGDKLRVRFSWHGSYPIVERLLHEAVNANVEHSHEIGRLYSSKEFFTIGGKDFAESGGRILPETFRSKIILLNRK